MVVCVGLHISFISCHIFTLACCVTPGNQVWSDMAAIKYKFLIQLVKMTVWHQKAWPVLLNTIPLGTRKEATRVLSSIYSTKHNTTTYKN